MASTEKKRSPSCDQTETAAIAASEVTRRAIRLNLSEDALSAATNATVMAVLEGMPADVAADMGEAAVIELELEVARAG